MNFPTASISPSNSLRVTGTELSSSFAFAASSRHLEMPTQYRMSSMISSRAAATPWTAPRSPFKTTNTGASTVSFAALISPLTTLKASKASTATSPPPSAACSHPKPSVSYHGASSLMRLAASASTWF